MRTEVRLFFFPVLPRLHPTFQSRQPLKLTKVTVRSLRCTLPFDWLAKKLLSSQIVLVQSVVSEPLTLISFTQRLNLESPQWEASSSLAAEWATTRVPDDSRFPPAGWLSSRGFIYPPDYEPPRSQRVNKSFCGFDFPPQGICEGEGEGGKPQGFHETETPTADRERAQRLPGLDRQSRWLKSRLRLRDTKDLAFHQKKKKNRYSALSFKTNPISFSILFFLHHSWDTDVGTKYVITSVYIWAIVGCSIMCSFWLFCFPEEVMLAEENTNSGTSALDGKSATIMWSSSVGLTLSLFYTLFLFDWIRLMLACTLDENVLYGSYSSTLESALCIRLWF